MSLDVNELQKCTNSIVCKLYSSFCMHDFCADKGSALCAAQAFAFCFDKSKIDTTAGQNSVYRILSDNTGSKQSTELSPL